MKKVFSLLYLIILFLGFAFIGKSYAALCSDTPQTITCCCNYGWDTGTRYEICESVPPYPCSTANNDYPQSCHYIGDSCDDVCGSSGTADSQDGVCPYEEEEQDPNCNSCTLPECPVPLTDTDTGYLLANYRYCSHSTPCTPPGLYGHCYEPTTNSNQPQPSGYINSSSGITDLGFTSSTHAGGVHGVNSPLSLRASYYDPNGYTDIEAVYVWFRQSSATPVSPLTVDLDGTSGLSPKTYSNTGFGFMLHYEGGTWVPYVPSQSGDTESSTNRWVEAIGNINNFSIAGPTGSPMVNVVSNSPSVLYPPFEGVLQFNYSLNFDTANPVANGTYNIFVQANDIFSFTPVDNYPDLVTAMENYWDHGELRFPRQWTTLSNTITVDQPSPSVTMDVSSGGGNLLDWEWNASDANTNISHVVGNVYNSDAQSMSEITVGGNTFVPQSIPADIDSTVGHLSGNYAFSSTSANSSVSVDVGSNSSGSLVFYVTAFDQAGNIARQSISYDLTDWIFTHGDAVYSSQGTTYSPRTIGDVNAWNGTQLDDIDPTMVDISSELFAVSNGSASPLGNSALTGSYFVNNYEVYEEEDIYDVMLTAFSNRLPGLVGYDDITSTSSTLSGSLSSEGCTGSKCYARVSGNVVVNSGFTCDKSAIIFVGGNLTINPNLNTSNANRDACIFVVNGSTTVTGGAATASMYHVVDAHIISNGDISVQGSGNKGLIVKGGLISDDGTISISRHMDVGSRNTFPSVALIAHPKYGYLAKDALGTPISLVKYDVGFKGN